MGDWDEGSNCCSFKLASHWIMLRVDIESMDHAQLLNNNVYKFDYFLVLLICFKFFDSLQLD